MAGDLIHCFEREGRKYAVDPETCFCFECDAISWDVLQYYPDTPANRIYHILGETYEIKELREVIGELEWLRATKSILRAPKKEDMEKLFEVDRGISRVSVDSGGVNDQNALEEIGRLSVALLLGRSGNKEALELELTAHRFVNAPRRLAELARYAFAQAALAGKKLTVAVRISPVQPADMPDVLKPHTVGVRIEPAEAGDLDAIASGLAREKPRKLAQWAGIIEKAGGGSIVVTPRTARFSGAIEELEDSGFDKIEFDVDTALAEDTNLSATDMMAQLEVCARYYARRLLKHRYFRLDPVASLFWRIYNGTVLRRADPAGTNALAVDSEGAIYPSRHMMRRGIHKLGSIRDGRIDEHAAGEFDDIGSLTTPACLRCWARNLCGGGATSVHEAFSGSFRVPHETWCDAQRRWIEAAVAAFSALSAEGVNFTRMYHVLDNKQTKPSVFALARAAFRMNIGVRPIEEADAQWLTKWEDWNDATYFSFHERSVLLATKYDREMDALHPRGAERELVLIRKTGDPLGLLKIRPERVPGLAQAWLYMHDPADYASRAVQRSFRSVLKEAAAQPGIRRIIVPCQTSETGLSEFLEAVGFSAAGTLREALYLHGGYRDVTIYAASAA